MNINDKSQIRPCTSCQVCGAVCPTGAISVKLNDEGFYRPYINLEACIDCGKCVKTCYKFDDRIIDSNLTEKKLYAAWAKSDDTLKETTSGGVADILAKELIKKGYKCIGVVYNTDKNIAENKIAYNYKDALEFRGSKYIQSLSLHAFKELIRNSKKEKFAVFGLPCQIYAFDKYLTDNRSRENHILIDLYCHGCPSMYVWKKYISEIKEKLNAEKVISVNFRSKIKGWGNYYVIEVYMEDLQGNRRKYVSPKIKDKFYELFFSDLVLNDSCSNCKLRSTFEYTDIRLGDFWGKSFVKNHKGVSGVTISTFRGQEIFNTITGDIHWLDQDFSAFLPYQSYGMSYDVDKENRKKLLHLLEDPTVSLNQCVKFYNTDLSYKIRLFKFVKNIIKSLPDPIISTFKSLLYSLKSK